MKWEYLTLSPSEESLPQTLSDLGQDGWELTLRYGSKLIFKRMGEVELATATLETCDMSDAIAEKVAEKLRKVEV